MGKFPACYPMVGLILGFILFILARLLGWANIPVGTSAILLVMALAVLTRGFHLDGLADTADALLSHRSLERKLEILKDSHLGTFGVLAILADLWLKASLLSALAANNLFPAHLLVLFPIWGRLTASVVAVTSKPVGTGRGLGYNMVAYSGRQELFLACLYSIALSGVFGLKAFLCALMAILVGYLLAKLWKATLGGVTGDLLGASVELGELASLFLFVALN
jgi:adenosylcobinamide-GDP ribazoletransferase